MTGLETISFMSVHDLVHLVHQRELSPVEICDHFLGRIEEFDGAVNAFCTVDEQDVRAQARASEKAQIRGEFSPLHGIPVGIKDLIFTRGLRTTGGSVLYSDLVPQEDDVAVERIRRAGGIVLGKTNTAEFGFTANQTDNHLFGATRNPWDLATSPGGSSGGSAAAVAAGLCPVSLGSDGGGSIRIPSSFCGLVGLKPTFGRIPLYPGCRDPRLPGLSAWEAVEHIGPIARTVSDAAWLLDLLTGPDLRDRHSVRYDLPNVLSNAEFKGDLTGLTIAYSRSWGGEEPVDLHVGASFDTTIARLTALGATMVEDFPEREASRSDFASIVALDADPVTFRTAIQEYGTNVNVRVRQMLDREWTFDEVASSVKKRKAMYLTFTEFFARYDAYLTPTVPFTAQPLGQEGPAVIGGQVIEQPARAVIGFCYPFNLTGHPAVSVPSGSSAEGMPIGIQVVARWDCDATALRIAMAIESVSGQRERTPDGFDSQLQAGSSVRGSARAKGRES